MRRFVHSAATVSVVLFSVVIGVAQQPAVESQRIDRLVALAKMWAAVKYFHPYLAYRNDIDWDQALVDTIPKVKAARDIKEYAAAVEDMLQKLGDPVTRVLDLPPEITKNPTSSTERQPTFRRDTNGVLVVSMTRYSDLMDFVGSGEKLEALKKELPKASGVVFDLRPETSPTESEQGNAAYTISESGIASALTTTVLKMPGERRRMHQGYVPQEGTTSGSYSSGFYLQGRSPIKPRPGAKDMPVVFLIGPNSDLPDIALGLQASGRGAIVTEGSFNEEVAVTTQNVDLPDGVRAQIRLGELVYGDGTRGFQPNLKVSASAVTGEQNAALQAAIQVAKAGKFLPPSRTKLADQEPPQLDKSYEDMEYPSAEYRVLANPLRRLLKTPRAR